MKKLLIAWILMITLNTTFAQWQKEEPKSTLFMEFAALPGVGGDVGITDSLMVGKLVTGWQYGVDSLGRIYKYKGIAPPNNYILAGNGSYADFIPIASFGFGTVVDFSSGNLSPLFTTSVATSTTTPALSFSLNSQLQNLVFASPTGVGGTPTFRKLDGLDFSGLPETYVAFGGLAGIIDYHEFFKYIKADFTLTIGDPTGGDPTSGYVRVTNGTDVSSLYSNSVYVSTASLGEMSMNGGQLTYQDTGGDLFKIGRTAWSTDMYLNFPAAKGAANEVLKVGTVVGDDVNLIWSSFVAIESDPIWLADKPSYLTSAIAAATYTPLTRTLTINGSTQDLSANRTWNVGTVTSFSATDGSGFDFTVVNGTTTPTLSLTTSLTAGRLPYIGPGGALVDNQYYKFSDTQYMLSIGSDYTPLVPDRGIISITSVGGESKFVGRNINGSYGTPTATLATDPLVVYGGAGHDGTSFSTDVTGGMKLIASENWTTGGHGTYMLFAITQNGSTSLTKSLRLDQTGYLRVNGFNVPNYPLDVTGDVNTSGIYRISGTQIAASNLSNGTSGSGAVALVNAPTFTGDPNVPDEVYGSAWNGSTEIPTKNAVYDKINAMPVDFGTVTDVSHTGSTSETKSYSISLPANTLRTGDIIEVVWRYRKTGTAGSLTPRIRFGTADDLTGTVMATSAMNSNALYGEFSRWLIVKTSTTIEVFNSTQTNVDDVVQSTSAVTTITIDLTVQNYMVFSMQLGNSGDTGVFSFASAEVKRY